MKFVDDDGTKYPAAYFTPKAQEAREATLKANMGNELVLGQLEKDSDRREIYEENMEENKRFLDATCKCDVQ